ncbi:GNAT family N-acetyltransferase [Dyella sp.]|uniref:GNAT family N-acetyltransferase n=1 Tax=Dyella sp. TaxID=1869338 RepID=UPI002ED5FF09
MSPDIQHDRHRHRFETRVDGVACVLDYQLSERVMTVIHTVVPEAVAGRGIAANLTRMAMDTARQEGWKVVPACSYAEAWMRRHPEYADLRA